MERVSLLSDVAPAHFPGVNAAAAADLELPGDLTAGRRCTVIREGQRATRTLGPSWLIPTAQKCHFPRLPSSEPYLLLFTVDGPA